MKFARHLVLSTAYWVGLSLLLPGCNQPAAEKHASDASIGPAGEHAHEHEDHDHDHGPHDGEIIELGSADYHAELVHDEAAGKTTIYILDGGAAKPTAIDAKEIAINATIDGAGSQFKLAADPATDDPAGKSSVFTSTEPKLLAALDAEGANPQLVVTIDGKQHRGDLTHKHHDH